jgi:hypothetical protein
MSDYVPMKGPLPGRQYEPSNGTEGGCFLDAWCSNCARDKAMREGTDLDECDDDEKCEIIAASYRGEAVEWRELDNGDTVCLAFIEAGTEPPAPRCEHTADMFGMPWWSKT